MQGAKGSPVNWEWLGDGGVRAGATAQVISVLSLGRLTKVSQSQRVRRDIPHRKNRMCKSTARGRE